MKSCSCLLTRRRLSLFHNEGAQAWNRGRTLPIKHRDRKSLGCHWLMPCLPIISVCVYVCVRMYSPLCHTCQSSIPLGSIYQWWHWEGVTKEWQREGSGTRAERIGVVKVTDVCSVLFVNEFSLSRDKTARPLSTQLTVPYLCFYLFVVKATQEKFVNFKAMCSVLILKRIHLCSAPLQTWKCPRVPGDWDTSVSCPVQHCHGAMSHTCN